MTIAVDREPASTTPRVVSVAVTGAAWPLGRRVVERLRGIDAYEVHEVQRGRTLAEHGLEAVDVVVHLAPGDHDALAARGRSAAVGTQIGRAHV